MRPWVYLATAAIGMAVLMLGCKTTRAGYESAPYKALLTDGSFELRDYRSMVVAEAPMESDGMNGGFNKLFRFITGSNSKEQKIAMTTPVFVQDTETNKSMAFVMPAEYGLGELPKPTDSSVSLRNVPGAEYAVYRFSGTRSREGQKEAAGKLMEWVKARGWEAVSEPHFAYYDPPWTPSFLRRNEALVQVRRAAENSSP